MESVWYYARGGAQTGPVSFDDLKAAIKAGQLGRDDLVWKEGTADWVPLNTSTDSSGSLGTTARAVGDSTSPGPACAAHAPAAPTAAPAPMSIYDESREWPTGEKPGAPRSSISRRSSCVAPQR